MKTKSNILNQLHFLIILLISTSCAQLLGPNWYSSDNGKIGHKYDDTHAEENSMLGQIFIPGNDYFLMNGDDTPPAKTIDELQQNAPSLSKKNSNQKWEYRTLNQELQELEEQLTDHEYNHYQKHKNKLPRLSDKIYFLKLKGLRAKDEYLYRKGHVEDFLQNSPQEMQAIRDREIVLGMTKQNVIESWGQPVKVDFAGDPRHENERWAFFYYGKIRYVYFENGRVRGWEFK